MRSFIFSAKNTPSTKITLFLYAKSIYMKPKVKIDKPADPYKRYETPWDGWNWIYGMYLIDPEGNRYSQEMIRSSIFTMQIKEAMVGTDLQIYCLKKELQKRLNAPVPEILIRWDGEEMVIPLDHRKFKK